MGLKTFTKGLLMLIVIGSPLGTVVSCNDGGNQELNMMIKKIDTNLFSKISDFKINNDTNQITFNGLKDFTNDNNYIYNNIFQNQFIENGSLFIYFPFQLARGIDNNGDPNFNEVKKYQSWISDSGNQTTRFVKIKLRNIDTGIFKWFGYDLMKINSNEIGFLLKNDSLINKDSLSAYYWDQTMESISKLEEDPSCAIKNIADYMIQDILKIKNPSLNLHNSVVNYLKNKTNLQFIFSDCSVIHNNDSFNLKLSFNLNQINIVLTLSKTNQSLKFK